MLSGFKIQHDYYCGAGLIPGSGIFTCHGCSQKTKPKQKTFVCNLLWTFGRSGCPGSHGKCMFNFVRNGQAVSEVTRMFFILITDAQAFQRPQILAADSEILVPLVGTSLADKVSIFSCVQVPHVYLH